MLASNTKSKIKIWNWRKNIPVETIEISNKCRSLAVIQKYLLISNDK